jgi:hypothetical protein
VLTLAEFARRLTRSRNRVEVQQFRLERQAVNAAIRIETSTPGNSTPSFAT